nr:nuclear pore complex protein NUP98A-like [Tanacetum cinerariifolium]
KASAKKPKGVSSTAQTYGEYTESASTSHQNGRPTDNGNGNHSENGFFKEQPSPVKITQKSNGLYEDQSTLKLDSYISLTGHRAGEAAIVYEHDADIEALMPKLRHSDYYTEPRVQELAAKERAEPGFCRRVKDFTVGRHNYGSIKFHGETDVRRLDLESLVQFNHHEVIVYMDETKKPPVGLGLNKPAEVTLLNIKCSDKKTGKRFTEGRSVEKYTEMLKRKVEDQGAEFVSYDPIKGEWNPTLALRSSLERIVTTSGRGFDDWQCRLATLPFTFFCGGRKFSVYSAAEISAGKKVDIGLGGGRRKLLRPIDMSLYSCDVRIDVSVDLTRSSHLTEIGMTDFVPDHVGIYTA